MSHKITKSHLFDVFTTIDKSQIPFVEQTEYLIDGVFKTWTTSFTEIKSAICMPNQNGELEHIVIGKTPKTGLPEAFECLASSEKAYNNGFGEWPMLSVEKRIHYVEKFITEMLSLRAEVVHLTDSYKVQYKA